MLQNLSASCVLYFRDYYTNRIHHHFQKTWYSSLLRQKHFMNWLRNHLPKYLSSFCKFYRPTAAVVLSKKHDKQVKILWTQIKASYLHLDVPYLGFPLGRFNLSLSLFYIGRYIQLLKVIVTKSFPYTDCGIKNVNTI